MAKEVLGGFGLSGKRKGGDIIDMIADEQDEITRIKENANFRAVLEGMGFELHKKGEGHMIKCPFHEDKTPSCSVNLEEKWFNCFGCRKKGDIIDFVRAYKGTNFAGALAILQNSNGKVVRKRVVKKASSAVKDVEPAAQPPDPLPEEGPLKKIETVTLDAVADYYHREIFKTDRAITFLKKRGISNAEVISQFKVGFCNGTLGRKCTEKGTRLLTGLGILRENGMEHFNNYITFPIVDARGRTVRMYGRSINPESGVKHLFMKGGHKGVFNRKASKVYDEIILTESIIDALSLVAVGLQNVQALYGINGFTKEHLQTLKEDRVKQVIIALDNDKAGKKASGELAEQISAEKISVKRIFPETKDWNEDLVAAGKETGAFCETVKRKIEEAVLWVPRPKKKAPAVKKSAPESKTNPPPEAEKTSDDESSLTVKREGEKYLFETNHLIYRLLGVKEVFISNLKVNIRVKKGDEIFIDNCDLYSARSRSSFSQNLARILREEVLKVENHLMEMVLYLEKERDKRMAGKEDAEVIVMTDEEKQLGLDFLHSPDLIRQIPLDLQEIGYVGEEQNKLLMYLAATSRKLDDPISILVLSQSASGKSLLVDAVKKLMPPEEVISLVSLSDQAFNYMPEKSLMHKFITLAESVHSEVIEYQIREMLSGHELSRMVAVKDERTGRMVSRRISKKVIVSTAMSSTNLKVNPENASRCFVINADESEDQTKRIHQAQWGKYSFERNRKKKYRIPEIVRKHVAAQRLLEKVAIVNPYAHHLTFPSRLMRTRRDNERFMDLIATICFLRQYQKEPAVWSDPVSGDEITYIECDLTDYEAAYGIMTEVLIKGMLSELTPSDINLYDSLRTLARELSEENDLKVAEVSFTQRQIRERTGYSQSWIKQHLRRLVDFEYIRMIKGGRNGMRNSYRLRADEAISNLDISELPSPGELKEMIEDDV